MKLIKDYWLVIILVVLFGGNLVQYLNPIVKVKEVVKKDTVTTVRIDSISLTRAKAELNYLRSQLKTASGKIKYVDKVSEIEIHDTTYIVPDFIASLDTTFQNDSKLSLAYNYPQNTFNLNYQYKTNNTKIVQSTTIIEKPLFDFSHGILVGGFVSQDGVIRLGVGYGFKLGLNL